MSKCAGTESFASELWASDLRNACFKLKGMSYLLELCGEHPAPPLDEGDAFFGVGLILSGIHDEFRRVACAIDEAEVRAAQKRKRKSGKRVKLSGNEDSLP